MIKISNKRKDNKGRVLRKGESQRNDLTYMYRWTDRNGERKCIYENDLNLLRKKEDTINNELMNGVSRNNIRLKDQIETYLETKVNLANSTKENYVYYFNHSIRNDRIGNIRLVDLKKSDILLFYKRVSEVGLKNGTIHILHKIIHPALDLAVDDGIILKNPSNKCLKDYPDNAKEKYALSFEEENEFFDRINSRPRMKRYYEFFAIMLYTGLRISEIIGLMWNDIDMTNRTIDVNHQLHYRKNGDSVKFYITDNMKTDSGARVIPMNKRVYDLFLSQRKIWFQVKKDPDYNIDGYSNFVFLSNMTGHPIYPSNVRRMLRSIVEMNEDREVQLPHITPHILRHTACTRYAEAGFDLKVIMYYMGQCDYKTMLKVYNHVDIERARRELDKLDALQNVYTNFYTNLV